VYVPSIGASGGLIIIWDSSIFSGKVMHCEQFAISVYFTSTQSAQSWTLGNVYGPCSRDQRDDFVQWLFNLNIPPDEDWLLVGDYNFIRSPENRNKLRLVFHFPSLDNLIPLHSCDSSGQTNLRPYSMCYYNTNYNSWK
jgi:hypothetical protein